MNEIITYSDALSGDREFVEKYYGQECAYIMRLENELVKARNSQNRAFRLLKERIEADESPIKEPTKDVLLAVLPETKKDTE